MSAVAEQIVDSDEWADVRLGNGIKLLSGHHVLAQFCNSDGHGVPYLTGPADFPEGKIQHTKFTTRPSTMCEAGDILITVKGSGAGKLTRADACYCISRQLMAIRVSDWDSRFVEYALQASATIADAATGLIPGISRDDILATAIALPPLPEQQAIAEVLSDADALIESLENLIAKKRAIKQGAMQELLSGQRRLQGFIGEWKEEPFGKIFDFLPTATNSRGDLAEDGEMAYVHYGDIHTRFHDHLDFGQAQIPRIERSRCKNAALLKNGDWIMADASEDFDGVGKSVEVSGLAADELAVSGLHTFLLREKQPTFAPGFKGHLGNARRLREQYLRVMTGMKVFGVSKGALRDLVIPIPEWKEQAAICNILNEMSSELTAIEDRLAKARQIKQGMMQDLLTGKVRLV